MNLVQPNVPSRLAPAIIASSSSAVLGRIAAPETLAVIWKRPWAPPDLDTVQLPRRSFENGLIAWADDFRRRNLDVLFDHLELGSLREVIRADALSLLEHWFRSASVPHAYLSLSVIADPGCIRWHVDRVGRRLLTTYVGPGTEWLGPSAAAEWRRDKCCFEPTSVHRLTTGHVMIMRGSSDDGAGGLVHRAPAWSPGAAPRLLFRICDGEYHLAREGKAGLPMGDHT